MVRNIRLYKVILLFLVIYFSCNSFVLAIKYQANATTIMVAIVLLAVAVALLKQRNRVPSGAWVVIMLATSNILITFLANGYMNAYILLFLELILALAFVWLYTRREFIECYICVMKLLAIYAIVIGVINTVAPGLLSIFSTYISSNRTIYYDAVFAFQCAGIQRLNSIWGEPGMFSVFLIFAMTFECFFADRPVSYINLTIFAVAQVLTFSSAGYVCMVLIIVAILASTGRGSNERRTAFIMLVIGIVLYIVLQNTPWMQSMMQGTVNKITDSEDMAFIGRAAPILYNIQEGLRSPLWGNGLREQAFFVDFSFYSGILYCNTSTTTFLFNVFGIIIPSISIYLTWKLSKLTKQQGSLFRVILFTVLLLNVNAQAVHIDQIYWLILFLPFMRYGQCGVGRQQYEKHPEFNFEGEIICNSAGQLSMDSISLDK